MLEQGEQGARDLPGRRVVRAHDDVDHHVGNLGIGEALTVVLGLEQSGDQIVAGIGAARVEQSRREREQLLDRLRRGDDLVGLHESEHAGEHLRPARELGEVVVGDAHQLARSRGSECASRRP